MSFKITLIEDQSGPDWPVPRREYRIEGEAGYCEFGIWGEGNSAVSSYGGSTWPFSWPDVFEYVNPGTYYAGYVVRDLALLPKE